MIIIRGENLFAPITPSDTDNISLSITGLYVGTSGDLNIVPQNGDDSVMLRNVPVGQIRIAPRKILATGTTASNIIAFNVSFQPSLSYDNILVTQNDDAIVTESNNNILTT
jgi:hypothetical protein